MKQSSSLLFCAGDDVELSRRHLYTNNDAGEVGPVVPGSTGARLVDGLRPAEQDQTIIKKRCAAVRFSQWLPGVYIS